MSLPNNPTLEQVSRRPPVLIMETDVGAIIPGGVRSGWISGSPANLAASATVNCLFDLGPDWDQYPILQVVGTQIGPATSVTYLFRSGDSIPISGISRALRDVTATNFRAIADAVTSAAAAGVYIVRPLGRYLQVQVQNTDGVNAAGAGSKVVVSAYPA